MMISVEQSVERLDDLYIHIKKEVSLPHPVLGENLLQRHFAYNKSHKSHLGSNPGCHGGKRATNGLSYSVCCTKSITNQKFCICQVVEEEMAVQRGSTSAIHRLQEAYYIVRK
jgi:hypothetical protein